MANIASLLKSEITRLARKELREQTDHLKKASVRYRAEIAALKRRIGQMEQQLGRLQKASQKGGGATAVAADETRNRFSAKGLKVLREKRDLSAAQLGRLLGVTAQSVYNWEAGKTRPRQEQVAAIAVLRGTGKRELRARLEQGGS